jgi:hypothetical protein
MYPSICRTRIEILAACGLCRAEVAANQRFQDRMASVSHDTAIEGMSLVTGLAIHGISIVKITYPIEISFDAFIFLIGTHFAEIPQTQCLIFPVRYDVPAISFGRYVC